MLVLFELCEFIELYSLLFNYASLFKFILISFLNGFSYNSFKISFVNNWGLFSLLINNLAWFDLISILFNEFLNCDFEFVALSTLFKFNSWLFILWFLRFNKFILRLLTLLFLKIIFAWFLSHLLSEIFSKVFAFSLLQLLQFCWIYVLISLSKISISGCFKLFIKISSNIVTSPN